METQETNRATYNVVNDKGIGALVTIVGKDVEDLKEQMADFEQWLGVSGYKGNTQMPKYAPTVTNKPPIAEDLGKCPKCGAPNKRSMKGKVYCSDKCWLKGTSEY